MKTFKNKTIVITGATSGLGLAIAIQAIKEGAKLVLISRSEKLLDKTKNDLQELGDNAESVQTFTADLSKPEEVELAISFLDKKVGTIDAFINNAGRGLSGEFVESEWDQMVNMLQLNVVAVARLSHWIGQKMKAQRNGSILHISALAAVQPQPYFGGFGASRSFVTNLSLAMCEELKDYNVTVCCAHPGSFASNFEQSAKINNTLAVKMLGHMDSKVVAKKALSGLKKGKAFFIIGMPYNLIYWFSLVTPKLVGLKIMRMLFKQS